jgi:hypothetical protein
MGNEKIITYREIILTRAFRAYLNAGQKNKSHLVMLNTYLSST